MKNTFVMGLVVVVLLAIGAGAWMWAGQSRTSSTPQVATPSPVTMMGSRYQPFSSEVLRDSAETRRVLFFYANWCPTCRPADRNFVEQAAQIPTDVTVIRVNYNDTETDQVEKDLAWQYGITYQHTYVQIDAAGNEVAKWNGGQIEELLSNLK